MDCMMADLGIHRVNELRMDSGDADEDDIPPSKRRNSGEPSRIGGHRSADIAAICRTTCGRGSLGYQNLCRYHELHEL